MRILIGLVDNHLQLYKQFSMSLLGVVRHFDEWSKSVKDKGGPVYTLDVLMAENGGVDDMRNFIVDKAKEHGYDYIFWMDTDQTFPADCLPRLLSYCERDGRDAASGLYVYKLPPYLPHIYPQLDGVQGKYHVAGSFPIDKPMKIEGAGFGCLLMRTSVFDRVERPYFTLSYEGGKMVSGEDLTFCKRAKMDMVLDPNVICGHLKLENRNLADYLNHNGIEILDGWVKPTAEQMDAIIEKQKRLME